MPLHHNILGRILSGIGLISKASWFATLRFPNMLSGNFQAVIEICCDFCVDVLIKLPYQR